MNVTQAAAIAGMIVSLILVVATLCVPASDAKKKGHRSAVSKLATITKVSPQTVAVGATLTITGTNFTKGNKKMVVLLRRAGGSRVAARATATSSTKLTLKVPDVTAQLVNGIDTVFNVRLINKYGLAAKWIADSKSPTIGPAGAGPSGLTDCDLDGITNSLDPDDDNDLLLDINEATVATDACKKDTDDDGVSDYYEVRVATEYNGGPVLPYPGKTPFPNPLTADSDVDHDGDKMTMLDEFKAWQYTGRMDRFYNDANQDSDGNGVYDDMEDEDADLIPNFIEMNNFSSSSYGGELDWLVTDTDGDGLCDGLDDQDHDGPATPVAQADCTRWGPAFVPNGSNGSVGDNTLTGRPGYNPTKIDGDDNIYGNWYEWFNSTGPYSPCTPSVFPVSPFCPHP